MKKKIGVLLCGCGHRDGSEVHEATLTLLHIDRAGAEAFCFAPHIPQTAVRNHASGEEMGETRDVLVESARIARGKIHDIAAVSAADFDALIIPGGQGAAANLSTFLVDGPKACAVNRDVERVIAEAVRAGKPIGAICIAPATLAKVLEHLGISATLTLGRSPEMLSKLEEMKQKPAACASDECVVDEKNRIVSTPAYIHAESIGEVYQGIGKLMHAVMRML